MRKIYIFGIVVSAAVLALPLRARAEDLTEDQIRQIVEKAKPYIEAEVQRRVKEELEKQKAAQRAAPPTKEEIDQSVQGAIEKALQEKTASQQAASKRDLEELKEKVDAVSEAQKKTLPSEFNPAIGVVGETVFSYRSRNARDTGSDRPGGWDINQRSVELNIAASVDPFAKGYAVINAAADAATGEATLGVEEAALQTTSLPGNLELKAGRFFGEFGRLEYIHDHELPFVNRPLSIDQYIGGESRTDGLQINWLVPVPHYVSWTVGVGDSFGGDVSPNNPGAFRSIDELNFWTRLSTYFDLAPDWQAETGVSGLWNPRTNDRGGADAFTGPGRVATTERERRLAGLDFALKYVPLRDNQFRSVTWGTEALYSNNRYLFDPNGSLNPTNSPPGLSGDEFTHSVGSLGLYSCITYKFSRQWSAGFLFDYVQDAANEHDVTYAYSPYITWALSHWNQLRLQYTHTDPTGPGSLRSDDAMYLQWDWIIGAHSHGWQQR